MLLPRFLILAVLLAVQTLACVAVEQDRVLAKDLAAEHPWFASLDPSAEIVLTPLAGSTRMIRRAELAAVARRLHAADIPPFYSSVCIERVTAPLTPERVQPVLEKILNGSPVRILDLSRNPVPRGEMEFTRARLSTTGLWRGRVIYGQGHSVPVWVKIATDFAALEPSHAQPRWVAPHGVERGERISVEVASGAARLAFQATAESAGHAGESVLVRNPVNGRLFQGKVFGNGKVLVQK